MLFFSENCISAISWWFSYQYMAYYISLESYEYPLSNGILSWAWILCIHLLFILYKSMRCTRESLLSTYHSHTLPWMNLIAILWYYNENHVGALKLALIINFVGSAHNQWRIGIMVLPGFSLLLRSKSPLSSFLVCSAWHLYHFPSSFMVYHIHLLKQAFSLSKGWYKP